MTAPDSPSSRSRRHQFLASLAAGSLMSVAGCTTITGSTNTLTATIERGRADIVEFYSDGGAIRFRAPAERLTKSIQHRRPVVQRLLRIQLPNSVRFTMTGIVSSCIWPKGTSRRISPFRGPQSIHHDEQSKRQQERNQPEPGQRPGHQTRIPGPPFSRSQPRSIP